MPWHLALLRARHVHGFRLDGNPVEGSMRWPMWNRIRTRQSAHLQMHLMILCTTPRASCFQCMPHNGKVINRPDRECRRMTFRDFTLQARSYPFCDLRGSSVHVFHFSIHSPLRCAASKLILHVIPWCLCLLLGRIRFRQYFSITRARLRLYA